VAITIARCSQGLSGEYLPITPKRIGIGAVACSILSSVGFVSRIESSELVLKHTEIVSYRPQRAGAKRRYLWLLPAFFGLSLLPTFQSKWSVAAPSGSRPSPTKIVVDALRLAVVSPAAAAVEAVSQIRAASFTGANGVSAAPLQFLGAPGDRDRAADCLALAAWYEAGTNLDDQRSVMQVVLNRVAHPSFPKSVCGVVFDGSHRSTGCQFTFTCDGSMVRRRPSPLAMARARAVATLALKITIHPEVSQATHYHADYVTPWWSSKLVRLGKVGPHIFYRWPGSRGNLSGRPTSANEAELAQLTYPAFSRPDLVPMASGAIEAQLPPTETLPPSTALAQVEIAESSISLANPAPKTDGAIFFSVDKGSPSGRWAISALGKCTGQPGCRVLAYETQERLSHNSTISAPAREKPIFLFVRDAASGVELALWDCEKVARPSNSQCLPDAGQELSRLLRDRRS
jgi:hypothetical protein